MAQKEKGVMERTGLKCCEMWISNRKNKQKKLFDLLDH